MPRTIPQALDRYLTYVWDNKGSDLHLTAGIPPLARIDGELHPLEAEDKLTPEAVEKIAKALLAGDFAERFVHNREVDFSFSWADRCRVRGNAFRQRGAASIALRLIPFDIPTFEDLRLPPVCENLCRMQQGLVLVTGPTGQGKSTTLASMIARINATRRAHIITIEDPIEYLHQHQLSAVNQREVGEDTPSFADALRAALREDPDVLLVGEMRDLESIAIALTIAETGHLVLGTLHTNDTAQALDRIVDVFPGDRQPQIRIQLANTLAAVLHQRLLPMPDGGRVAAFEVLLGTHSVRNLVREGKSRQIRNVITTSKGEGMQTLEDALTLLVGEGLVDYDVAVERAIVPSEVRKPAQVQAMARRGRQ